MQRFSLNYIILRMGKIPMIYFFIELYSIMKQQFNSDLLNVNILSQTDIQVQKSGERKKAKEPQKFIEYGGGELQKTRSEKVENGANAVSVFFFLFCGNLAKKYMTQQRGYFLFPQDLECKEIFLALLQSKSQKKIVSIYFNIIMSLWKLFDFAGKKENMRFCCDQLPSKFNMFLRKFIIEKFTVCANDGTFSR